ISTSSSCGTTAASTGTPRSKRYSDWPHTMSRRAIGTSLAAPIPVRAPRRSGVHHVAEKQRVECAQTVPAKSGPTAKFRLRKRGSRYMWTSLGQRDKPQVVDALYDAHVAGIEEVQTGSVAQAVW